jgi:hypothetical protein
MLYYTLLDIDSIAFTYWMYYIGTMLILVPLFLLTLMQYRRGLSRKRNLTVQLIHPANLAIGFTLLIRWIDPLGFFIWGESFEIAVSYITSAFIFFIIAVVYTVHLAGVQSALKLNMNPDVQPLYVFLVVLLVFGFVDGAGLVITRVYLSTGIFNVTYQLVGFGLVLFYTYIVCKFVRVTQDSAYLLQVRKRSFRFLLLIDIGLGLWLAWNLQNILSNRSTMFTLNKRPHLTLNDFQWTDLIVHWLHIFCLAISLALAWLSPVALAMTSDGVLTCIRAYRHIHMQILMHACV